MTVASSMSFGAHVDGDVTTILLALDFDVGISQWGSVQAEMGYDVSQKGSFGKCGVRSSGGQP